MKDKIKHIANKTKNDRGVVIVEAAIVFPVMFFILLFIIFIGNLFYEQARVDDIVMRYAIKGAQCVTDPFLYDMYASDGASVPKDPGSLILEPYRYVLSFSENGCIGTVEKNLSTELKNEINSGSLVFFDNTGGKYLSSENDQPCTFKNHFLYSSFVVQVTYQVKIPISFMDTSSPTILKMSSRAEVPVGDTDEFIRNIDMAVDLLERTSLGEKIESVFDKVTSFINKFASK